MRYGFSCIVWGVFVGRIARRVGQRGPLRAWVVGLPLAAGVWLLPMLGSAGNTVHPRTPVEWPNSACIHTVDRSVDPHFEFSYGIPFEDLNVTSDELEDSRRHQFLAFCRHWDRETGLPNYVSEHDLMRAEEAGLEDAGSGSSEVLELDPLWTESCWSRIVADDARRPISFASARSSVVWDTTDVSPGVYRIAGYTWEPPLNLWAPAPWAVRVVDQADSQVGPTAVMGSLPTAIAHDEVLPLDLCVDAAVGSQVELAWALKDPDPAFEPLVSTEYSGTEVELAFEPPASSWGQSILLAVTVVEPDGARYTAHGPREMIVFAEPEDAPGTTGTTTGEGPLGPEPETGDSTAMTSSSVDQQEDSTTGSGCAAGPRSNPIGPAELGLMMLVTAGSRRTRAHSQQQERRQT